MIDLLYGIGALAFFLLVGGPIVFLIMWAWFAYMTWILAVVLHGTQRSQEARGRAIALAANAHYSRALQEALRPNLYLYDLRRPKETK